MSRRGISPYGGGMAANPYPEHIFEPERDMTTADSFTLAPSQSQRNSLGAIARLWAAMGEHAPLVVVLVVVALWASAVAIFGLPGLYLPAVAFSPVMIGILVAITQG